MRCCTRVLFAILALLATAAHAAGPQLRTSPAGWYRVMLGEFEITALNDGTVEVPVARMLGGVQEHNQAALARQFVKDPVETSINAYLVNTGARLVLIDAGASQSFSKTLGKLLANFKASGYQPEQVDEIYITHMHGDHIGGLVADGKPVFPHAIVRADAREAAHWLSQANLDAAPEAQKRSFRSAMLAIGAYRDAGRFKPFEGETELAPGIHALPTYGHTPGHTIYPVESKGQRFVVWGDLLLVAAVQIPDPTVPVLIDNDGAAALIQRRKTFAAAAAEGHLVGAAHIPFPGLGRVRAAASGFDWVPVDYTVLRP